MGAAATIDRQPLPHNIELEQALLGAMLTDNDASHRVSSFLQPEHFFEPIHRKIYELVSNLIRDGRPANPITLRPYLPSGLKVFDLTASQYLARLAAEATGTINAADYGRTIYELAARRQALDIAEALTAAAHDPHNREFAENAVDALAELVTAGTEHSNTMRTAAAAARDFIEHVAALYQGTATDDAIKTGLLDLDERIGGFRRGSLVVLAARPSMGKTTLAGTIGVNAARLGYGVAFFSLEMPARQIMARVLADALFNRDMLLGSRKMSVQRLAQAQFTAAEFDNIVDAARDFEKLPFVIDDAPNATVGKLLAKTQMVATKFERQGHRLDVILVDYLKFISASDRYAGQRVYEVGEITRGLRQIARRLNAVVLLCCQLNREVEKRNDRRPQLSDLRESGDIEADADLVLLLYRESYYLQNDPGLQTDPEKMRRLEQVEHRLEIIVAKNRLGPTTTIPAYVDLEFSAVRDLARQGDLAFDRGRP